MLVRLSGRVSLLGHASETALYFLRPIVIWHTFAEISQACSEIKPVPIFASIITMRMGLTVGGCRRGARRGQSRASRASAREDGRRFGPQDRVFEVLAPPKDNAPPHPASAGLGGRGEGTV